MEYLRCYNITHHGRHSACVDAPDALTAALLYRKSVWQVDPVEGRCPFGEEDKFFTAYYRGGTFDLAWVGMNNRSRPAVRLIHPLKKSRSMFKKPRRRIGDWRKR